MSRSLVRRPTVRRLAIACGLGALAHATAFAAAPARHYQLSADTAFDVRTRLEWARQPSPRVDLSDAPGACTARAGGNWRIPSARELETLVDVRATTAPTWDRAAFGAVAGDPPVFWTLTPLPASAAPARQIVVDFRPTRSITAQGDGELAFVRCVRGPR